MSLLYYPRRNNFLSIRVNIPNGIICRVTITIECRVVFFFWIAANPQAQPWLIVPCPIVIQSRLLIEFLRIEKIRRIPNVVALLNENLTERYILDMLHYLAINIVVVVLAIVRH